MAATLADRSRRAWRARGAVPLYEEGRYLVADFVRAEQGADRLLLAQSQRHGQRPISPGGLGWETIVTSLGIVPKVRRVLSDALAR